MARRTTSAVSHSAVEHRQARLDAAKELQEEKQERHQEVELLLERERPAPEHDGLPAVERQEVRAVDVLPRQVLALVRGEAEGEHEERQHQVIRRERPEDAPQVEAPDVLDARGRHGAQQDRPDEEPAQHEEEVHPEEDRQRLREEARIELDALLGPEDPRHVVGDDGQDRDDAHPVQRGEPVVEQIEGEEPGPRAGGGGRRDRHGRSGALVSCSSRHLVAHHTRGQKAPCDTLEIAYGPAVRGR